MAAMIIGLIFNWSYIAYAGILFFIGCLFFFRNPERVCRVALQDDSLIISPADGKIISIEQLAAPTEHGFTQKIAIFLSPLDVHVQRACCVGLVKLITYHEGTFMPAWLPKSSIHNERNDLLMVDEEKNRTIMIRQIAGSMARSIICWVSRGVILQQGNAYGMICFGSRVELFLPHGVTIYGEVGDRIYGGHTVIGRW